MWGKVNSEQQYLANLGITPTHVGKSRRWRGKQDGGWDHPHPCGEKLDRHQSKRGLLGSPPPMWGKDQSNVWLSFEQRITPTHVGKREVEAIVKSAAEDHPHPCGEKAEKLVTVSMYSGSPPPMWGKGWSIISGIASTRITPTHVGKSYSQNSRSSSC